MKIVQQKSLLTELFETEGETRDTNFLEIEEREFAWQEKVFSSFETKFYQDEKNCITDIQKEYHELLKNVDHENESRLYSKVEKDSYYPDKMPLTTNYRSPLSIKNENALPTIKNRKPFSERYNKKVIDTSPPDTRILANHYLYKNRSAMYILADLTSKDETIGASMDAEILLCTIIHDKASKTLTIDPNFTNGDCYTVEASGIHYDYWIEHSSMQQTSEELWQQKEAIRHVIIYLLSQIHTRNILNNFFIIFFNFISRFLFSHEPFSRVFNAI